jgi:hydrogenase maturation protease
VSSQPRQCQRQALVLGVGNVLFEDEGLGVRALERLHARYLLPATVHTLEGGVLSLDLLPYLDLDTPLLIMDAVQTGMPPGHIVRLEGEAIARALGPRLSLHQVGLKELLAVAQLQGTLPPQVVLWGVEPARLGWGTDLSPAVSKALDALVDHVAAELRAWGHDLASGAPEGPAACRRAGPLEPLPPPRAVAAR